MGRAALRIAGAVTAFALAGAPAVRAQDPSGSGGSGEGGGADRNRDLSVTVYNENLGLVKDRRTVTLARGSSEIVFTGVAAQLDPTSVHIRPVGNTPLEVAWQDYRNDFATTDRLLQRYVDQRVEVRMKGGDPRRGALASFDGAFLVLRGPDGALSMLTRAEVQEVALASLPGVPTGGPTLVWRIRSAPGGAVPVEVSYLTGGLTWHAEYVAIQDEAGTSLEIQGWATVENTSGETYENALVKLVAGSLHRAAVPRPMQYQGLMRVELPTSLKLDERGFSEYHLYELPERATIANNEVKQLGLFHARGVKVARKFVYDSEKNADQVMATLEFQNEAASGIGMPLPAGVVRVYQRDRDGALEFAGEDRIQHTAKNEKARVAVGGVFDVAVERKQTDFKQVSARETETTVEITLRNHRDKAIDVTVAEHAYGSWEVVRSSYPATKKDATTLEFSVRCAPEKPVTVSYTLRTTIPGVEPR